MTKPIPYVLGLDLGTSSLGWAVLKLEKVGRNPVGILDAGVRIFEAGVEGVIEQGKDSSRAVVRRQARQPRRQQWRRQHRNEKLFSLLQEYELLPQSNGSQSEQRKLVLDRLDRELAEKHLSPGDHQEYQKLPYILRDKAATGPVEAFMLGRALYHLAQRRGYLSNRKTQGDDDEQDGKVAEGIGGLQAKLNEQGDTLGSYFARRHNPFHERIRRRYTGREMYWKEFERIQAAQNNNHPQLTPSAWIQIHQAIFFQRPLKSQKHLIGRCELEKDKRGRGLKRCALALPIAQEFRILQKVNDLRVTAPGRIDPELTPDERKKLVDALNEVPELSWAKVKSKLKLPRTAVFSLEEWEKSFIGHRTNAKMSAVFGARWFALSDAERDTITLEVLYYRKPEALKKRAIKVWGLSEESAGKLAKTHLEEGYARHSRKAMIKLIHGTPTTLGLKDGNAYSTIRRDLYPEEFEAGQALAELPPVNQWKNDIRNPAVIRALTELRKVVNSLIKTYGTPKFIHIELARDIRNSRKKRKDIWKQNDENRKRREKAVATILAECGVTNPRRRDIDKWLLAEECNRECPYCGKTINMQNLMGDNAEFNIEHIFPRRFLDDSYLNKTIACRRCNDHKGARTPATAYSAGRLEEILQRVERFQGFAREIKLARFRMVSPPEDFTSRQLNDTRYNSKLAAEFLGLLFGGRIDAEGKQHVFTPTGLLTAKLRGCWQLNDLLGGTGEKSRDDHCHHTIDAIVIGLTTQDLIRHLAESAAESERHHSRHFIESISWPWTAFKDDVAGVLDAVNVSYRPTRTIAGPLHAGSNYSKNHGTQNSPEYRIRKEIQTLKKNDIEGDRIVDPSVRRAVQEKYAELGQGPPEKVFSDPLHHPALKTRDGREIPIHKVRIRVNAKPRAIGKGVRQRNIVSGDDSNYASMVYTRLDDGGNETRWEHEIVTRLEAHERLSKNRGSSGDKVLRPQETDARRFKFALRKNDMILAVGPDGKDALYRVQSISASEIQLCDHRQPDTPKNQRNLWNRISSIDNLRKRQARKVEVSPIGVVAEATL